MRKITQQLWKYLYADRAVAPRSDNTSRNTETPRINSALEQSVNDIGREENTFDLIELVNEVAVEQIEKKYLELKLKGLTDEGIKQELKVAQRTIDGMRATIVKRIQESKASEEAKVSIANLNRPLGEGSGGLLPELSFRE